MKYQIDQEVEVSFTAKIFEIGRDMLGNEYYAVEYKNPKNGQWTMARGLNEDMIRELLTPEMITKARMQ